MKVGLQALGSTAGIKQSVTLTKGISYQLLFYAHHRNMAGQEDTTLQANVEGVTVFGPQTLTGTFVQYTATFQVACGTYEAATSEVEFEFHGSATDNDKTVMLDNIELGALTNTPGCSCLAGYNAEQNETCRVCVSGTYSNESG